MCTYTHSNTRTHCKRQCYTQHTAQLPGTAFRHSWEGFRSVSLASVRVCVCVCVYVRVSVYACMSVCISVCLSLVLSLFLSLLMYLFQPLPPPPPLLGKLVISFL